MHLARFAVTDTRVERSSQRLERIERALEAQRAYIQRVPDPDNRYRAETNLMTLLEMRDALRQAHSALGRESHAERVA